ncbi:MAG: hypothetical protein WKG01_03265 [Kofleriaceae bacterium]
MCTVAGLLAAWQIYALPRVPGDELSFGQALRWRYLPWQVWVFGMPLIGLVRRRFASLVASVPLHIVMYAAITVTNTVLIYTCGSLAESDGF